MEIGKEYIYITGTKMFLVEEQEYSVKDVGEGDTPETAKVYIFHWADDKGSINALQLKQEQIDKLIK